jgi:hypothetical protein
MTNLSLAGPTCSGTTPQGDEQCKSCCQRES